MLYKWLFPVAMLSIAVAGGVTNWKLSHQKKVYYYNAYAPGYDEYFIVKSYTVLTFDTVVHFDEHATVTNEANGYQCKILSTYTK